MSVGPTRLPARFVPACRSGRRVCEVARLCGPRLPGSRPTRAGRRQTCALAGRFEREAARVREALGDRVVGLEHVGSTSVPGLAAKPVIDMVLELPDSSDEQAYAGALEAAGYVLHIREDDWLAQYADAKTEVVGAIMARAEAGGSR